MSRALTLTLTLALAACAPELGGDPARITTPRVLAIAAEPAEAAPGEPVVLRALVADPAGGAAEVAFAWCTEPRGVAENRVGPQSCLLGEAVVEVEAVEAEAGAAEAVVPADACATYGPSPPPAGPGETPRRPADPDATGGYHQPFRATAAGAEPALGRVRLRCALPGAPVQVAVRYAMEATPNRNPVLSATEPMEIAGESRFDLRLGVDAPESYLAYDRATATLSRRTEAQRATWYTSSGTITGDLASATWQPTARPARAWVVVRDERGGVAWAEWHLE